MKKLFLTGISVLFLLVLLPNEIRAASCASQGGQCIVALTCAGGPPIPNDDCSPIERCCPITTPTPTPTSAPGTGSNPFVGCPGGKSINSAIGCIPILTDENTLMVWILGWAIGIGGGVAFLLIVYAGFMIMTSQGNPDRLQAGKELLTSALAGIILLVFSIFLLKLIGVDILKLPGFGVV